VRHFDYDVSKPRRTGYIIMIMTSDNATFRALRILRHIFPQGNVFGARITIIFTTNIQNTPRGWRPLLINDGPFFRQQDHMMYR